MKATVNLGKEKLGVINLPFYPTEIAFNSYKAQYPNLLIEIRLVSSGALAMAPLKSLSFISKMDMGIPRKSDWDF